MKKICYHPDHHLKRNRTYEVRRVDSYSRPMYEVKIKGKWINGWFQWRFEK